MGPSTRKGFTLEFDARRTKGDSGLAVCLPVGESSVGLFLSAWPENGGLSGLGLVDGLDPSSSPDRVEGDPFEDGKDHHVKLVATATSITAEVDGKTYVDWEGDSARLSAKTWLRNPDAPLSIMVFTDFFISNLKLEQTKE